MNLGYNTSSYALCVHVHVYVCVCAYVRVDEYVDVYVSTKNKEDNTSTYAGLLYHSLCIDTLHGS